MTGATLVHDFAFLVGKAAQIVSDAYAGAALGEITFRPAKLANAAEDFTIWHFVFWLPKGRATIAFEAGRFNPPEFLDGNLVGDHLIHPPINKTLNDAFAIMRAAGFTNPVKKVVLRHDLELGPSGSKEPLYSFEFPDDPEQIRIGSDTGNLTHWSPPAG